MMGHGSWVMWVVGRGGLVVRSSGPMGFASYDRFWGLM